MKKYTVMLMSLLLAMTMSGCAKQNDEEVKKPEISDEQKETENKEENKEEDKEDKEDQTEEENKEENKEEEKEEVEVPSVPETPVVPETPAEPVVPEVPVEPETPAEPEIPAEPETPAEPEAPAESAFKGLMDSIYGNAEYEMPRGYMDLDADTLSVLYGISADQLVDYVVRVPMMNVQATEVAFFEVKDGEMDALKAGVAARLANLDEQWKQYLPDQYEMVKNAKTYESGNYYFVVISKNADAIISLLQSQY